MFNIKFSSALLCTLFILCGQAGAETRLVLGAKLLAAGWQGDNGSVAGSFNSDEGAQFALSASLIKDKFYAGLSLQSGSYKFSGTAPDQFTPSSRVNRSNDDIKHQEFDLLAGYYFWPNVSIFADLKAVSNTWDSNGYKQTFGGLGLGISAYYPINDKLTAIATLGFIGNGDIKDTNKVKVGDGNSGALELGAVYRLSPHSTMNFGAKFRTYHFQYLDDSSQDYSVNGLFIGYNHNFEL